MIAVPISVLLLILTINSLPLEKGFERNFKLAPSTMSGTKRQPTIGYEDSANKDPLYWSLSCLGFDEYRRFTMDPQFHFRVLDDHLTKAEFKERSRLSEKILSNITVMADIDEVRISIETYRHWDRERLTKDPRPDPAFFKMSKDFVATYVQNFDIIKVAKKLREPLRVLCRQHP